MWARWQDPFHPAIYFLPMLVFVYSIQPLMIYFSDPERFLQYAGGSDSLLFFQLFTAVNCATLVIGISAGSRGARKRLRATMTVDLYFTSVLIGGLGFFAWIVTILNVGGFEAAFGRAYGGGFIEDGHILEASRIGLIAVPLLIASRSKGGMRASDWAVIAFIISPVLIQGLLGARRGPTFLALTITAASYVVVFQKKIPLWTIIPAAGAIGYLLLFLVANRSNIYLGSGKELSASVTDFVSSMSGSEYLFSSAIYRYVFEGADPFYGLRVIGHMVGRLVPKQLWPTVYEDIALYIGQGASFYKWAAVPVNAINATTGWVIPLGAAPGMIGDYIMEFGAFAPLAAAATGFFYGRAWQRSQVDPHFQPVYVLLCGLSIYLATQTIEAWLYRVLLFGIPAYFILNRARRPQATHDSSAAPVRRS